eukprot:NODE_21_length_42443_cov_0.822808.p37 type:complete len:100 gc:universal NODE_21_length_42443_cov_0.822808:20655-20954(+)
MINFNENFESYMKDIYDKGSTWRHSELNSDDLEPHNSQVLWFAVTQSVAQEQSSKASDWKNYIEERQRKIRQSYPDEKYPLKFYDFSDDWLPYKFKMPK